MSAPYDPDLSHALLIAVLMKHGGSVELDSRHFAPIMQGNDRGEFFAAKVEILDDIGNRIRVSVAPASEDQGGGGR